MRNIIKILTDALSDVATEAVAAAQEAEAQQKRADEWYGYYQSKDAALKEAQTALDTSKQRVGLCDLKPGDRITIDGLTVTVKDIKEVGPGGRILTFEEPVALSPYTEQQKGATT